jgi:hypothetical protein
MFCVGNGPPLGEGVELGVGCGTLRKFALLVSARRRDVASVAGLWFTDGLLFFFLYFFYLFRK